MSRKFSPFLLLCLLGGLAIFSSTMAKNPALPLFIRALNVPIQTVGFIAAASTVVGVIVSLPAGVLSDVFGRRRIILVSAVIFATAPFMYLFVHSAWQLVLVRIYHGFATAILGPVAMAAVVDTFSRSRGERMGWYSSATMIGRFLAPFVGGALIFGNDFHWVYLADGIGGVFALVAALAIPLSTKTSASAGTVLRLKSNEIKQEITTLLTDRHILMASSMEAVQYFGYGCLETFLPIYLNEQAGFSTLEIGSLFTIQVVVATLTKPLMGRISDRYGRVRMIVAGLLLGGVTLAFITHFQSYALLVIFIGLFGLGLAVVTASTAALVADLSRTNSRGSALGVLSSVMDIGHSTGPMVAGLLITASSYNMAFGIIGLVLAFAGMVFGFGVRGVAKRLAL